VPTSAPSFALTDCRTECVCASGQPAAVTAGEKAGDMMLPPVFQVEFVLYGTFDGEGSVLEFASQGGYVLFTVGLTSDLHVYVVYDDVATVLHDAAITVTGGSSGILVIKYGYGKVYLTMETGTVSEDITTSPVDTSGTVYGLFFGAADIAQSVMSTTYISDVQISGKQSLGIYSYSYNLLWIWVIYLTILRVHSGSHNDPDGFPDDRTHPCSEPGSDHSAN
jgi:hypothetical protein